MRCPLKRSANKTIRLHVYEYSFNATAGSRHPNMSMANTQRMQRYYIVGAHFHTERCSGSGHTVKVAQLFPSVYSQRTSFQNILNGTAILNRIHMNILRFQFCCAVFFQEMCKNSTFACRPNEKKTALARVK